MSSCLRLSTSKIAVALILAALLLTSCCVHKRDPLLTALERSGYSQLAGSPEIAKFLAKLAGRTAEAEGLTIATSALGRPVDALLISSEMHRFKDGLPSPDKITLMLVGSQHGTEPSGAEALLLAAREIVEGSLHSYVEDMNFVLIPNSNPDGRDLHRRLNGNGVNLSTNFTVLSEPESRGIMEALYTWKPEVVLDVHESAVLKKKSLAKQGYLIDFEAQFEGANNPNVDCEIRTFSFDRLLPHVIARVNGHGLHAQRYIGEITDIKQPITHGGLSLRNLRNVAGMMGSFSFLLENKLDPSTGAYPTPRNIRARVAKQYLCISSFLRSCHTYRAEIIRLAGNARTRWQNHQTEEPLFLIAAYIADPKQPCIALPLKKLETGERVKRSFRYHGRVACRSALTLPVAYIVTAHQKAIQDVLDRHHVKYEMVDEAAELSVEIQPPMGRQDTMTRPGHGGNDDVARNRLEKYAPRQGDLMINLDQPSRRLIPLLLEPESSTSIFKSEAYAHLVDGRRGSFVHRVYTLQRKTKSLSSI